MVRRREGKGTGLGDKAFWGAGAHWSGVVSLDSMFSRPCIDTEAHCTLSICFSSSYRIAPTYASHFSTTPSCSACAIFPLLPSFAKAQKSLTKNSKTRARRQPMVDWRVFLSATGECWWNLSRWKYRKDKLPHRYLHPLHLRIYLYQIMSVGMGVLQGG